ncbi:MAG: tetratricopeptide repeat protein [Proteobacteria bacterium]|nr:tetratricopeptide repeat protein [Pseudomonadota bacterium]MBU1709437.1 tetratricopeptide repeat protein [Pseudomonadota bacterium]
MKQKWLVTFRVSVFLGLILCSGMALASEKEFEIAMTKGSLAVESASFEEARTHLQKALDVKPDDTEAMLLMGIAWSRNEKYSEAKGYFVKLLRKNPDSWRAKFELGVVLYHLDAWEDAGDLFSEVVGSEADDHSKTVAGKYLAKISAAARARDKTYTLNLLIGGQWDDNVILEPEDPLTQTDEADWRWLAVISGNWAFFEKNSFKASAGYMFYQSLHDTLHAYDVHQHNLTFSGEYDPRGPIRTALEYDLNYSLVGREKYSTINTIKPVFSYSHSPKLHTELYYAHEFQDFDNSDQFTTNSSRNGDSDTIGVTEKILLAKNLGLSVGYAYDIKGADMGYWQYDGHKASVKLSSAIDKIQLFVDGSYYDKKYDDTWPGESTSRKDKVQEYSLVVVWNPLKWLTLSLTENYVINDSNIAKTDFTRNITGFVVGIGI